MKIHLNILLHIIYFKDIAIDIIIHNIDADIN